MELAAQDNGISGEGAVTQRNPQFADLEQGDPVVRSARVSVSPEALSTCVGHLVREWDDYGYRIVALHQLGWSGAGAIEVRHSDGSEFFIGCGRYGEHVCHADTLVELVEVYSAAVSA